MHSCCTQLQQRTVMQPACVILLFYLSNRLLLPAVSLARWCLRALEDSFPDCGFCRGPSLRSGDNGRKREEREGQMGMTHKTEALMELPLLKLVAHEETRTHNVIWVWITQVYVWKTNFTERCGGIAGFSAFYPSVCMCVWEPIPPSSACSESRQAGKVGGRATFFLSSSLWSSLTAARRGLGAAASTVTSWKI